jgi:peptide/nickel transport system substrate-binding protein
MLKRTAFVCILVLLLLPAFAFASSQQESSTSSTGAGATGPQYGGTLTLNGGASEPPSPSINDAHHAALAWLEPIQERIIHGDTEKFGPGGNGEYAFQLVAYIPPQYQKGHLISDWDLTQERLIWTVRKGIMWQAVDGVMGARELTADDIAKDVQRFVDSPWGNRFDGLLKSVKAVGDTVVLEYENYSPELFYFIGYEDRAIISPPETTEVDDSVWENQGGTGAFAFDEYVVGSYMSYVKNPNYWGKTTIDGKQYDLPFIDKLVSVIIPDESTAIAALRTGAVDHMGVNSQQWDTLEATTKGLERNKYGDMVSAISLKTTEPPFDNRDVRRALSIGTDYEAFKRYGKAEDFPTHVFPSWSGNPGVYTPMDELPADVRELYEYDPAKAKKMLADAGYPNGFEMEFYINSESVTDVGFASLLQNEWAKIGVKVEIVARDYVTYRQYRDTFTFTGAILAGTQIGNATGSVINLLGTDGWLNYAKYSNPRVDALSAQIAMEMDGVKQNAMIKEAAVIAAGDVANIGAYLIPQGMFWWPWVKNYHGEVSIEDGTFGALVPYIWIDQDLKKEMGF